MHVIAGHLQFHRQSITICLPIPMYACHCLAHLSPHRNMYMLCCTLYSDRQHIASRSCMHWMGFLWKHPTTQSKRAHYNVMHAHTLRMIHSIFACITGAGSYARNDDLLLFSYEAAACASTLSRYVIYFVLCVRTCADAKQRRRSDEDEDDA